MIRSRVSRLIVWSFNQKRPKDAPANGDGPPRGDLAGPGRMSGRSSPRVPTAKPREEAAVLIMELVLRRWPRLLPGSDDEGVSAPRRPPAAAEGLELDLIRRRLSTG